MHPGNDGDEERRSVEIRARTVDEAVARGLVRLGGLSRSEVRIEILDQPKSGVLGFGTSEALVRLTTLLPGEEPGETVVAPPAADEAAGEGPAADESAAEAPAGEELPAEGAAAGEAAPEAQAPDGEEAPVGAEAEPGAWEPPPEPEAPAEAAREAKRGDSSDLIPPAEAAAAGLEVVRTLVDALGFEEAEVKRSEAWLPDALSDDQSLVINVGGGGSEGLLERDGEGMQALQFIARLILSRRLDGWVNLLVDVDGDRARRVQELVELARQSADLVERDGRPVSLPPMSPYDRRVVHLVLKDHGVVATQSIGRGDMRKVTVRRVDQLLPEL